MLPRWSYLLGMTGIDIGQFHEQSGARFEDLNGVPAVSDYGDVPAEYQALSQTAGVLDLSFRGRLCLTGSDRVRFLNGQVTNDVKALQLGTGCYAALVNAKGKIESDLNIYRLENELLLDFEPGLAASLISRFDKFIIADDVQVIDVSNDYGLLSVQGPQSDVVVRPIAGELPAKPLAFTSIKDDVHGELYCMRVSRGPELGFDLFVPAAAFSTTAEKLITAAQAIGGRACGWRALDIARIEAGFPRFGQDMDPANLASETGIEQRAISYAKGCYIGQEVISRIRAYGQVAKALRGLRLDDSLQSLPAKGEKLLFDGKEVGHITSAVLSPRLKMNIALGYVRREHNDIGTELFVKSADQLFPARIVGLPFAAK
jgi:folate-binding protein YgfZ